MRIFQALSAPTISGMQNNQVWLKNLYEPLLDLGHEVYLFHFDWSRHEDITDSLVSTFIKEQKRKPFDLFFGYFQDDMVAPNGIQEIKQFGVVTCNFSCNNTHQFDVVKNISPAFDYSLHAEKDAGEKFKNIGASPIWFPMAANPKYYRPYDMAKAMDVCHIGQNYAKRLYYVWHLLENKVDMHIFGPGWILDDNLSKFRIYLRDSRLLFNMFQARSVHERASKAANLARRYLTKYMVSKYKARFHPPLSDEEMIKKFSESHISLGFLEVYDQHNPIGIVKQHLHLREFEAPMAGALYFTGYCQQLEEFYELEKEIVTYRNEHELLDKVRYFLSHPADAERVRQAGHRRAKECHTYQKRFKGLFKELGLN